MLTVEKRVIILLSGLKIVLFLDTDEYIGKIADSVGAIIAVHSPFVKPDLDEHSVFAAPGSAVYISMQAVGS